MTPEPAVATSTTTSGERQLRPYHHNHKLRCPFDFTANRGGEPCIADRPTVDAYMDRSFLEILVDVGFQGADPVAMSFLKDGVDKFISHFLSHVRLSMTASRRSSPIAPDFELALHRLDLWPDLLLPYLKPPSSKRRKRSHHKQNSRQQSTAQTSASPSSPAAITPTTTTTLQPEVQEPMTLPKNVPAPSFLGSDLNLAATDKKLMFYIPRHFPRFPSAHTYHNTPLFPERDVNPRDIRARATQEGRLGEEALRGLMRIRKRERVNDIESSDIKTKKTKDGGEKRLWGRREESMGSMFDQTMHALVSKRARHDAHHDNRNGGDRDASDMEDVTMDGANEQPLTIVM